MCQMSQFCMSKTSGNLLFQQFNVFSVVLHRGGSTTHNGSLLQQVYTHIYQIKKMTFQVAKHVLLQAGVRDFPHLQISCWGPPSLPPQCIPGTFSVARA